MRKNFREGLGELRADKLGFGRQVVLYVTLLLSSFAYNYSFILIDYVRPFLVRDLRMTLTQTALVYAAQGIGVVVGAIASPLLVAKYGSRLMVAASSAALGLLTLGTLFSGNFETWVVARFGVGVALAGCYVAATTLLANFVPPRIRGRMLAINMAMFSVALMAAGSIGAAVGEAGWRWILWVAVVTALGVAILSGCLLPNDRAYIVYADADRATASNSKRGRWGEMLGKGRLSLTLRCLIIAGLNFSGYQFYSGFITTYLINVRHFDASVTGSFVIIDGVGTLIGSMIWGWVADRVGRRANAIGFAVTAFFVVGFLVSPNDRLLLYSLEFGYAMCLCATACWGAYFAELFPVRLRPMGAALFHGGHIISLFAPLIVALVAKSYSLGVGMALAPTSFLIASVVWWSLPETLRTGRWYSGFSAGDADHCGVAVPG